MSRGRNHCRALGCGYGIAHGTFLCKRHMALVPADLRLAVARERYASPAWVGAWQGIAAWMNARATNATGEAAAPPVIAQGDALPCL